MFGTKKINVCKRSLMNIKTIKIIPKITKKSRNFLEIIKR